jgi:hypothetical protein
MNKKIEFNYLLIYFLRCLFNDAVSKDYIYSRIIGLLMNVEMFGK